MNITERLRISSFFSIGVLVITIPVLIWSFSETNRAKRDNLLVDTIQSSLFERSSLRDEYFLYREERARIEWNAKSESIDHLLAQAAAQIRGRKEKDLLEKMRRNFNDSITIFSRIVTTTESLKNAGRNSPIYEESRNRLISQILLKVSAFQEATRQLQRTTRNRGSLTYNRSLIISSLFILLVVAGTVINSMLVRRLLHSRLKTLHEGSRIISNGNLEYRIEMQGSDELVDLAKTINSLAERALLISEQRFSQLVEFAPLSLMLIDRTETITYMNRRCITTFGYDRDEIPTLRDWWNSAHPDPEYRQMVQMEWYRSIEKAGQTGTEIATLERWVTCKNGSVLEIDFTLEPVGENLLVVLNDITERKRSEIALQESERRLLHAEAIAHLGHWRHELLTNRILWSDETYRIFGVHRGNFQPDPENFADLIHPEDRLVVLLALDTIRMAGSGRFDFRIILPNGTLRYLSGKGEVEFDTTGSVFAMFGTLQDMTEIRHKERELEEKNAELERFGYAISHDLKSPLVTVKAFLGFLEQDLLRSDNVRIEQDIRFMHNAADKMVRLLDELLKMSRIGRVSNPVERVTFRELVDEALSMVAGRIAKRGVEVQFHGEQIMLNGDRQRLMEIWQNLLDNAVKYMGDQSGPRIEIGVEQNDRETVFFVRDNGIGINSRYQEKVFGLFEKLDQKSEGTGLGLALIKRIIECYRGKIWLESDGDGQGSCFRFTLPEAVVDTGQLSGMERKSL